ncbi:MAG TPA: hypothetical protein VGA88_00350, partial [Burkholderiales bacterium]
IVTAENYNDWALKPYQSKCPGLRMDRSFQLTGTDIASGGMPKDDADAEARAISITVGERNFQLFKVDIDNNPKNGQEYVLYYEGRHEEKSDTRHPADRVYQVVDLDHCEMKIGTTFNQNESATWTRNGIVTYKGKNMIYELVAAGQREYWSLTVESYIKKLRHIAPVCTYYKAR